MNGASRSEQFATQLERDPVEAARSLRPLLDEHADACDREGEVSREIFEAIREAGLFRITIPKRLGGMGLPFIKLIETAAELGKACPSSAWVQLVMGAATAGMSLASSDVVETLFKRGDETICGVVMRGGTARPVEGGYLVSGKWPYASGSSHADWCFGGVDILDQGGKVAASGMAFMPLRASDDDPVEVAKTWHVVGMRGTGSNTIVAEERFVPAHLVVKPATMRAEVAPEEMEAADRWPASAYLGLGLSGPMLGAAQQMLELVTSKLHSRPVVFWKYASQADSEVILESIGRSAIEIDSAWLHVRKAASMLDVEAQKGPLTIEQRIQIPINCGYAMELLRTATNRLMDVAGSSGFSESNPVQRLWRDVNFGSRHASFNSRAAIECYGRSLAGIELNSALI